MDKFYKGNMKVDSIDNEGWFLGQFIKSGLRKTNLLEIKYWELKPGKTTHKRKIQNSLEIIIILKGGIEGEINGGSITVKKGEYIVIAPNVPNNSVIKAVGRTKGITIKAPSSISCPKILL